jgi:hypothetical protein
MRTLKNSVKLKTMRIGRGKVNEHDVRIRKQQIYNNYNNFFGQGSGFMTKTAQVSSEKTPSISPRLLGVADAARYLGISVKTIRNGLGPRATKPFPVKPVRYGRRVLFRLVDLDAFADSL